MIIFGFLRLKPDGQPDGRYKIVSHSLSFLKTVAYTEKFSLGRLLFFEFKHYLEWFRLFHGIPEVCIVLVG
jgi:hypothetical protein